MSLLDFLLTHGATGAAEERLVARKLSTLRNDCYWVINDVMLPSAGKTSFSQIDHIVVSKFGIFCIETKSHTNWIFGNASNPYLTQSIYGHRYPLLNPLRQNYGHIRALEKVLVGCLRSQIHSLAVFPNADKVMIYGTELVGDIANMFAQIERHTTSVYTREECDAIVHLIKANAVSDRKSRAQHIREVRALVQST